MARYLVKRFLFAVVLVLAVSSASLVLTRLAPGDYISDTIGITSKAATIEQARARLGLNQSLGQHYREWLSKALRFDFGRSFAYDRPVAELVPERAANTALLAGTALIFATLVGVPLGTLTGSRSGGWLPALVRAGSLVLVSMPPLLTSLFLLFVAARTGWFPLGGMHSVAGAASGLLDLVRHMVVPVLALALPVAAMFERLQSQAMRETVRQPFVIATLARGVPKRRVVWRSALKAALRPTASVYGLVVASLLSGSFAVEMITAWPGLGRLMFDALGARDVYLVAGCAAAGALFLAVGSLLSDVALVLVDPRIRQ